MALLIANAFIGMYFLVLAVPMSAYKVVMSAGLTVTETDLKSNPFWEIMIFAPRIQESPSMGTIVLALAKKMQANFDPRPFRDKQLFINVVNWTSQAGSRKLVLRTNTAVNVISTTS